MGCVLKIRTIDYQSASNEGGYNYVQSPHEIVIDDDVSKDEWYSIEDVAHAIMRLPNDARKVLQDRLLNATSQSYVEKQIKEQRLISNVTIGDLFERFPQYKKDYQDIVKDSDIDSEYTMILCNKMEFAKEKYYGRYIDPDGKPVVIMNNQFGVEKFLRYLATKSAINNKVKSGENLVSDDLREDFDQIKSQYGIQNDQALILKFLDDKSSLATFTVKGADGKNITISTYKVLEDVISDLNEESRSNQSGFYLSLKDVASSTDRNDDGYYQWEMTIPTMEKVIKLYFQDYLDEKGISSFKDLSNEELKEVIDEVFSRDVKLMQAEIQEISEGKSKTVSTEESVKKVPKLAEIWKVIQEQKGLKAYSTELKKNSSQVKELLQKYFDEHASEYPSKVKVKFDVTNKGNSTLIAEYVAPAETKEVKGTRKIIFTFPFKSLGKYHDYGYDKKFIWLPVPKSSKPTDLASKLDDNGRYKGCYIYQYFNPKTNATEFVVSRNIITPESPGFIYSSLQHAMESIDKHNNEDPINSSSLYGINMHKSLRSIFILNSKVSFGQTISVIDTAIPNTQPKKFFNNALLTVFYGNVKDLKETFSASSSVQSINTPQEAAIFLYKFQQALRDNYRTSVDAINEKYKKERTKYEDELKQLRDEYKENTKGADDTKKTTLKGKFEAERDRINAAIKDLRDKQEKEIRAVNQENKSLQELIRSNMDTIDKIIGELKSAPVKHYFVEKVGTSKEQPDAQSLILREIPESDIDLNYNQLTRKPNIADLENAAKFFRNKYGVSITVFSKEELNEFKKKTKANIRDDAKAFVFNGHVYLNGSTADLSDMFHEVAHIFLRVLRNKKPKAYHAFIDKVIKDHQDEFYGRRKGINKRYVGFSEDDKVEENVVSIIASNMFRRGNLIKGFQDSDYDKVFSGLLSQIMEEYTELVVRDTGNQIEFDSSVRNILKNSSVKDGLLESARISNFIRENLGKKIIETDCV